MKFGVIGDLHLTNRNPERRKDDFLQTALGKIQQAMDFFESRNCSCVFQPGDFFDSPTVARRVEVAVIRLLMPYMQKMPVYACYGQHDISGHSSSTFPNSPLAVLEASKSINILEFGHQLGMIDGILVWAYGASFGEEIPNPPHPEFYNILATHRMIGNRPLWPGQPLEDPRSFLRSYPQYRVVIVGDYHYHFIDRLKDQLIINPGALMRQSITDIELGLKPSVFVIDLETLEVEAKELDVSPAEEIFDLSRKETKNNAQALNQLIEDIRSSKGKSVVAWKKILLQVIEERGASKEAQKQIEIAEEENKSNG